MFELESGLNRRIVKKKKLRIKQVKADFPATVHAATVLVKFTVPKATTSVSVELRGASQNQTYEYKQADKQVMWLIKKFNGMTEHMCKVRISFAHETPASIRKQIGPISMNFEIPMYVIPSMLSHHQLAT